MPVIPTLVTAPPAEVLATSGALQHLERQLKKTRRAAEKVAAATTDQEGLEAVHALRVASRRLRVGLRVYADVLPKKLRARLNHRVHRLQSKAAAVRDLDIWRLELERLHGGRRYHLAVAFAEAAATTQRPVLYAKLCRKAERMRVKKRWVKAQESLRQALAAPSAKDASGLTLDDLARRQGRRQVRAFHQAFTAAESDQPKALHEARLAAKNARYTLELFGDKETQAPVKAALRYFKQLQDCLGLLCDAVVFGDHCRHLAATATANADAKAKASLELLSHYYDKAVVKRTADFRHSWDAQQAQRTAALACLEHPQQPVRLRKDDVAQRASPLVAAARTAEPAKGPPASDEDAPAVPNV